MGMNPQTQADFITIVAAVAQGRVADGGMPADLMRQQQIATRIVAFSSEILKAAGEKIKEENSR